VVERHDEWSTIAAGSIVPGAVPSGPEQMSVPAGTMEQ
jgi:hypothetical protein